jgi:hypothetical protein
VTEYATAAWPSEQRPGHAAPRLHRPRRGWVALLEVVLAVVAVWGAGRAFSAGTAQVTMTLTDGTTLTSVRYFGNWLTGSVALGTLAGLLLLDAVREALLAIRTRHKPARRAEQAGEPEPTG